MTREIVLEAGRKYTPREALLGGVPVFIMEAERARNYAKHYKDKDTRSDERKKHYGAALLALASDQLEIFIGYNDQADHIAHNEPGAKICAEQWALIQALQNTLQRVYSIGVTGPYQPDDISRRKSHATHPCIHCRRVLLREDAVSSNTLILPWNWETRHGEVWTRKELLAYHAKKLDYSPSRAVFDDTIDKEFLTAAVYRAISRKNSLFRYENRRYPLGHNFQSAIGRYEELFAAD